MPRTSDEKLKDKHRKQACALMHGLPSQARAWFDCAASDVALVMNWMAQGKNWRFYAGSTAAFDGRHQPIHTTHQPVFLHGPDQRHPSAQSPISFYFDSCLHMMVGRYMPI